MCGVAGIFMSHARARLDEQLFARAVAALNHRGPDSLNVARVTDDLILGHTRLSIIDLHARSNQPMGLGGRYWIVYNGEIYNYRDLRRELESNGAQFRTSGDTEVILRAYALWGAQCVTKFNGMWAFAIFDKVNNSLFCSRDRFGEKPFYYATLEDGFIFASEINAILRYRPDMAEPEYNVISNFCRTSVGAQHAQTWFKRIQRLQPGHNLIVSPGRHRTERYWTYPSGPVRTPSFDEACQEYRSLFLDSVALRMRSDVPLGLTLSSGLDSTSIAYAMQLNDPSKHHCFTSSFDPSDDLRVSSDVYSSGPADFDEAQGAKSVAERLGLQHHIVKTSYSNFVADLREIIGHLGSGNSSPAVIPLFQLHKVARQNLTVVLEGQGADELLAGYVGNVLWPGALELARQGRILQAIHSLREFSRTYKLSYALQLAIRDMSNEIHLFSSAQQALQGLDQIYGPALSSYSRLKDYPPLEEPESASVFTRALRRSHSGGLVNLLHYGDAVSMSHGLESRLPFTDHRLVEFVWQLPAEYKLHDGIGKRLHREAMRGIVPDAMLDSRAKLGFATPIRRQFMAIKHKSEDPVEVLLSSRSLDRGLFNPKGLKLLIDRHRASRTDHSPLLFRLLSTELWFREFIDRKECPSPNPHVAQSQAPATLK
jgi:asparagine synthase (glutamine-hydrolysing)